MEERNNSLLIKMKKGILIIILLLFFLPLVMAGSITRSFSSNPIRGEEIIISLNVYIQPGDDVYAVQEAIPWQAELIDSGVFTANNKILRYVEISNLANKTLSYKIKFSSAGTYGFSGVYAFNNNSEKNISGNSVIIVEQANPACYQTCANLGYDCGIHAVCGISRDCGNCSSGTCNSSGKCVFTSSCSDTCISLGYNCGNHIICGVSRNCGSCSNVEECISGKCIAKEVPSASSNSYVWYLILIVLIVIIIVIFIIIYFLARKRQ